MAFISETLQNIDGIPPHKRISTLNQDLVAAHQQGIIANLSWENIAQWLSIDVYYHGGFHIFEKTNDALGTQAGELNEMRHIWNDWMGNRPEKIGELSEKLNFINTTWYRVFGMLWTDWDILVGSLQYGLRKNLSAIEEIAESIGIEVINVQKKSKSNLSEREKLDHITNLFGDNDR
jgi:hypothetical protein